jgi:hypothetical protein
MNTIRPSPRVLQALSPLRASRTPCIRQWHPRSTHRPQPRHHASTTTIPPPYKPRSRVRPFIWAAAFSILGYLAGRTATSYLNFFDHIERDSDEDRLLLAAILLAADDIPAVQQLLKHEGERDSEWDELAIEPHEGDVLLNETLRGSMGVVTPRAFWNAKEQELWMVVHYGMALCGWPGIAHGGCTATILLEGMGRALNALEGRTQGVSLPEPEHLGLTYLKPVKAGNFYLLKAKLREAGSEQSILPDSGIGAEKDLAKKVGQERSEGLKRWNKKYDVDCVLESLDGKQCMRAKGVWDVV